ncbi:MAG: Rrf2 family transcriptional regulator [candidate division Zixibacteria bacterium]|nr:Rrf2 family transcriptional regulator [candidate division Zixibacteria bacterium]
MLFSKGCTYAIRASLLVTTKEIKDGRKFIPIRELSDELDLSFHFLTKIMQVLTEAKIMESFRGPNGGVGLARPAREITLIDVIAAVDGLDLFSECALGLPGCGEKTPCPLHAAWAKRREDLHRMFEKTTLAGLAKELELNALRH